MKVIRGRCGRGLKDILLLLQILIDTRLKSSIVIDYKTHRKYVIRDDFH